MVTVGLWVRLEAKPGREHDLELFLQGATVLVEAESSTLVWCAVRLSPTTFAIFDAFPHEAGRQEHLSGRVAAALAEQSSTLLAGPPVIESIDILAAKLPC